LIWAVPGIGIVSDEAAGDRGEERRTGQDRERLHPEGGVGVVADATKYETRREISQENR
jgi:hypothetical protein